MMRAFSLIICVLFVSALSCKKQSLPPPAPTPQEVSTPDKTPPKPDAKPKPKDTLLVASWESSRFFVDQPTANLIYPGAVLDVDSSGGKLKLTSLKHGYTAISITAIPSVVTMSPFEGIPDLKRIQDYVSAAAPKQTDQAGYQEETITDYKQLRAFFMDNADMNTVLSTLAINPEKTGLFEKTGVAFRTTIEAFSLSVDFVLFNEEFMKANDLGTLHKNHTPFYVSGIAYGSHSLVLAEGSADETSLRAALRKLLKSEALESEHEQSLVDATVLCYHRDGSTDSYIRRATGLSEIKAAIAGLANRQAVKNTWQVPVTYFLRSLTDYSLFQYRITDNMWMKR